MSEAVQDAKTQQPSHGEDLQERWEQLHQTARYCPRYPDESVVRWALTSFPERSERKPRVLDLGCGAGRHTLFLAAEGFESFAVDWSRPGIEQTVQRAAEKNLDLGTQVAEVDAFDFPEDFFDAVLCHSVYCYLPLRRIASSIEAVRRVLKPGGSFLCSTRSDADWRRPYGAPIGPSRFRLSGLGDDTPGAAEDGLDMTLLDRTTLRALFEGFSRCSIDRRTLTNGDGMFADDDWIVTASR